ncbi:MAG TPA: hypothetical protein VKN64_04470 [Halanaerobiales bacterium]|nr:hypothetical protein [Halanaerobiales bacterium]
MKKDEKKLREELKMDAEVKGENSELPLQNDIQRAFFDRVAHDMGDVVGKLHNNSQELASFLYALEGDLLSIDIKGTEKGDYLSVFSCLMGNLYDITKFQKEIITRLKGFI